MYSYLRKFVQLKYENQIYLDDNYVKFRAGYSTQKQIIVETKKKQLVTNIGPGP